MVKVLVKEVAACALKTIVIITKQDCNERRYEEPVINNIAVIDAIFKTWKTHRANKVVSYSTGFPSLPSTAQCLRGIEVSV